MDELRQCPLCGSGDVGGAQGFIYCYSCKTEFKSKEALTTEEASRRWNADKRLDKANKRIEELENAIKYATNYLDESELNQIGSGSKAHWELRSVLIQLTDKGEG